MNYMAAAISMVARAASPAMAIMVLSLTRSAPSLSRSLTSGSCCFITHLLPLVP